MRKCLAALCVILCVASAEARVKFRHLKSPGGPTWVNVALSRNGKVMAVNYGGEIYRWDSAAGFVDLGPSDPFGSSIGISGDGRTIVVGRAGPDGNVNPAMWRRTTGWVDLGHPAEGCIMDGSWGDSWSTNVDGSIVVGLAWYCPGAEAFEWTRQNGMVGLGHPIHASSRATNISLDGSTIVGFFEDPNQGVRQPVRWMHGAADLFLGNVPGEAIGVSSDGTQIVGQAPDNTGNGRAFYYTDAGGLVPLGVLSRNNIDTSVAIGVSDNGLVIGASINPFNWRSTPFFWSHETGMLRLRTFLVRNGAVIPKNVTIGDVLAISADGSTLAGFWYDTSGKSGLWIATVY